MIKHFILKYFLYLLIILVTCVPAQKISIKAILSLSGNIPGDSVNTATSSGSSTSSSTSATFTTATSTSTGVSTGTSTSSSVSTSTGSIPLAPIILNLFYGSVIQTGFMVGTADANTISVEVSIDSGSYQSASLSGGNWTYKLPSGANTWLDNTQHTISVRSLGSGGATASATTITVRKGQNRDINGDGYPDLVSSAQTYSSSKGRVYIFHSSGNSGITNTTAATANTIITGQSNNDQFGYAVATGDVNGDGYADVVVAAQGYSGGGLQGRIYIFHSSGSSGVTITLAASATNIITGQSVGDQFAYSVSTGDINGDGYTDIVSGGYGYSTGGHTGRVYIFHSSGSSGVTITLAASATNIITGQSVNDSFGYSVSIGDINGDGYGDVISGAKGYTAGGNKGSIYIFHSSGSSGITITLAASANTIIIGESNSDKFGSFVSNGDINGDGYIDVIASSPFYNGGGTTGRVYIFYSSGISGVTITLASLATTKITGQSITDQFGYSIATGDVNKDGYSDLIVGANQYNLGSNIGRVYIFNSTGSSGITNSTAVSASNIITGNVNSDYFGCSVNSIDINADSFFDVIVGACGADSGANKGRVYIFHSSGSSGVTITTTGSASSSSIGENASDQFGFSVGNW